jgi:hypothetical protein
MSIDRVYGDKGYAPGNIVLCSRRANVIKSNLTLNELRRWIPSWYAKVQAWKRAGRFMK